MYVNALTAAIFTMTVQLFTSNIDFISIRISSASEQSVLNPLFNAVK